MAALTANKFSQEPRELASGLQELEVMEGRLMEAFLKTIMF